MSGRDWGNKPSHYSAEKTTNPSTSDVMADTGALTAGLYEVRVVVGASVVGLWDLQVRNAANSGAGTIVTKTTTLYTAAGQSSQFMFLLELAASERVRVIMNAGLTGTCCAALQVEKMT